MIRIIIISFILLTGCSAKFDSFDPSTTALRWILTHEKKDDLK
jgi:hypothetical protein